MQHTYDIWYPLDVNYDIRDGCDCQEHMKFIYAKYYIGSQIYYDAKYGPGNWWDCTANRYPID